MARRDPPRIRPSDKRAFASTGELAGPLVVAGALVLLAAAISGPRTNAPPPEPTNPPSIMRRLLIAGTFIGFVGYVLHWREALHILLSTTQPFWACASIPDFIKQFATTEAEQVILFFVALGFIGFPILAVGGGAYAAYCARRRH